jgi:2,3-bisphosphoglycerate-independent phosphoglycerate mutase
MDRGKNWERTDKGYRAIAGGYEFADYIFDKAEDAVQAAYERGETDEFIMPSVRKSYTGMKDGDGLILANFRADRMRQIADAFANPKFDKFKRSRTIKFSSLISMTEYSEDLKKFYDILFPQVELKKVFGEIVSDAGLKQLRIAESEKYAHVTFFFNGGEEKVFKGEDRIIIKSPEVPTYDLKPEMSAGEVTDEVLKSLSEKKHDVIILNYANPDMVGHTGDVDAAVKAVEFLDMCIGKLEAAILKQGGVMIVTADHGNCEEMYDEKTGKHVTSHSTNPVWFMLVGDKFDDAQLRDGKLSDIAPTMLQLLSIDQPEEMDGESLIEDR